MIPLRSIALAIAAGAALATVATAQTPPAQPPAPPAQQQQTPPAPARLPTVDGRAITDRDLAAAEAELAEALQSVPEAQRREQLVDYLVTVRVLAAQAARENLAQGPDFEARMAFLRDKYLMETFLRREIDRAVTPQAIEAFYNERVRSLPPEQEVRARHILVPTEDEAKAVIALLNQGRDFAELARERSTDPGSKDEGGDLGFFTRDRMVAEFATAAFALEPGNYTREPVRSQFGWHVIRVEERRQAPVPTLQELDGQIRNFLSRQAQGAVIQRLRTGARIER